MKAISRWLKRQSRLATEAIGYRLTRRHRPDYLIPLLYKHLRHQHEIYFVQIGANDGRHADPLHDFVKLNHRRVIGLVIEPVQQYFQDLQSTYRAYPKITPIRMAIHNTEHTMTIHRVDASHPKVARFGKGIASFDPDHHRRTGTPKEAMVAESVPCMRLEQLLQQNPLPRVDLLQMDTEGYDAEIICGLNFDQVSPLILRFEHGLQDGIMTTDRFREVAALLQEKGYLVAMEEYDAVAYKPSVITNLF